MHPRLDRASLDHPRGQGGTEPRSANRGTTLRRLPLCPLEQMVYRGAEGQGLPARERIVTFLDAWVLKPEYLPAWLQAGAAVVALGLGVWSVRASGAAQRRHDFL